MNDPCPACGCDLLREKARAERVEKEHDETRAALLEINTESERRLREALVAERQRDDIAAKARALLEELRIDDSGPQHVVRVKMQRGPASAVAMRALAAALDALEGK